MSPLLGHAEGICVKVVTESVEESFNKDEFIDGAKGALESVLGLVGSGDWEGLRGLVSARVGH